MTGFSGASLANPVEAALTATRRKASAVELQDFTAAIECIVAGLEKTSRVLNFLEEWRMNNSNPTGMTLERFRREWAVMTFYERFEQTVAIILSVVIAVIIVVSLVQLIRIVFSLLIIDAFNLLDHKIFQSVFGMIMTLLIAMEFKHSIVRVALRRDSIIQVKTVILIGLIALSRKLVILDPDVSPAKVAALAGAALALGLTYWLLCERDDRKA